MCRSVIGIEVSSQYSQQIVEPAHVVMIHKRENVWVFLVFIYRIKLLNGLMNVCCKTIEYWIVSLATRQLTRTSTIYFFVEPPIFGLH